MNLVIVESPTKAKTIRRFLGKEYQIEATFGHIRDLPKKELGVDLDHGYQPQYKPVPGKRKQIKILKTAVKDATRLILATDPDREGEAIAWHVLEEIGRDKKLAVDRIVFHEITKEAVAEALRQPRLVDENLVRAQQARRVLDRLVGYQLSPLLWEKVRYGLSAGRVQSAALRLVVERERERTEFKQEEYWDIIASLFPVRRKQDCFNAKLTKIDGQEPSLKTEQDTNRHLDRLKEAVWQIVGVQKSTRQRAPYPPFTTSMLQRAAAARFGFSAKKTMSLAQNLYERGLITYHRTDSTHLASSALASIRALIKKDFGSAYLPPKALVYKTKVKVAQEAHEAIRPTRVRIKEAKLTGQYTADANKLYNLIWRQAVASQMKKAVYDQTRVDIEPKIKAPGRYLFRATGSRLRFDGWLKVAGQTGDSKTSLGSGADLNQQKSGTCPEQVLPDLEEGQRLKLGGLTPNQHFTQPPPRYSEATLIKALEERGIGRPSTYAPILSTIQDRGYATMEEKKLVPTPTGEVVTDLLVVHFPKVVDLDFTAQLEEELDEIARGEREWVRVVDDFYKPFAKNLKAKFKTIKKEEVVVRRKLKEKCPQCGSFLVVKLGRYGEFISCSTFPDCDYSRPMANEPEAALTKAGEGGPGTDEKEGGVDKFQFTEPCPDCRSKLVLKEGRFGKFIACSGYPQCKYTRSYQDKMGRKCPECEEGEVVRKKTRRGKQFYGCSRYPDCDWANWEKPK